MLLLQLCLRYYNLWSTYVYADNLTCIGLLLILYLLNKNKVIKLIIIQNHDTVKAVMSSPDCVAPKWVEEGKHSHDLCPDVLIHPCLPHHH